MYAYAAATLPLHLFCKYRSTTIGRNDRVLHDKHVQDLSYVTQHM